MDEIELPDEGELFDKGKIFEAFPVFKLRNTKACIVEVQMDEHKQSNDTNGDEQFIAVDLTNRTVTHILDMNDDCLVKIFMFESLLDVVDLCSLAETCTRFHEITQRISPKVIRISKIHPLIYDVEFRRFSRTGANEVYRIFKNFGSILSAMEIQGNTCNDEDYILFDLISKHCGGEDKLKSLAIHEMQITNVTSDKLNRIFKQLLKLDLSNVIMKYERGQFSGLDSLVDLTVRGVKNCRAVLENIFPKLERFEYEKISAGKIKDLETFISNHKNLKTLKLEFRYCKKIHRTIILQAIGNSCKELEELCLKIRSETIRSIFCLTLQTLRKLRILKLSTVSFQDLKLFSPMAQLRELTLVDCDLPHDSEQYASLKQLTKLSISGQGIDSALALDIAGIICQLTNLEEFSWNGVVNEKTLLEIVRVVEGRSTLVLTLNCYFDFIVNNYDANPRIRLVRM